MNWIVLFRASRKKAISIIRGWLFPSNILASTICQHLRKKGIHFVCLFSFVLLFTRLVGIEPTESRFRRPLPYPLGYRRPFGVDDGTRTHKTTPLKRVRMPIPSHPHVHMSWSCRWDLNPRSSPYEGDGIDQASPQHVIGTVDGSRTHIPFGTRF